MPTAIVQTTVICLALAAIIATLAGTAGAGTDSRHPGRMLAFAHVAALLAVGLLALLIGCDTASYLMSLTAVKLRTLDWLALLAAAAAVTVGCWDRAAWFSWGGLYALGVTALSMGQIQRGYWPGRFFVWGALCEWSGFALVTALCGWALPGLRFVPRWVRMRPGCSRQCGAWFMVVQAILATLVALLTLWVSISFSFDGVGQRVALFGLSGRLAGCPAALMLIGVAMLMAWQTRDAWRARWQYAALGAGVLFTSSLGWARLDAAAASVPGDSPWLHRSITLLISSAMMTLLTRFGLARVLPRSGDWITRSRRAVPVFAGLALLMLAIVVAELLRLA